MLQMVALRAHIVRFVVDLSSAPISWCNGRAGVRAQAMLGDTAGVRQWYARCGIDYRDLAPIDRQGIVPPRGGWP
jgi:hypothetical protein